MNSSFLVPNSSFLVQFSNEIGQQQEKVDEWTWPENKIFEITVAEFGVESENLLGNLASRLPKKTISQILNHYKALVEDVRMIEDDLIQVPDYKANNRPRKKTKPWTAAEHE